MEWPLVLMLIFSGLVVLMMMGIPIAVCFLLVNIVGVFFLWGGEIGLGQLILSIRDSVTSFTLLPIPLFILMGEVMYHSGVATRMMDTLDMLLGRLPGRLGLIAVGGGTLFSTLSGSSMASTAMLGATLVPEMEKRGYKKPMSLGPILGSGGLAVMIPPSALAILLGTIGEISIGKILIAIILPGLLMAILYTAYIILRCRLQPSVAPSYEVRPIPILDKLLASVRYILPLGLVIFLVIGVIFLGVATPSEAAATGTLGTFILAFLYRGLNWNTVKKSFSGTLNISVMILMIFVGARAFSQILAFTGATRGLMDFATGLPLAPIVLIMVMQVVLLIMGMFMSIVAIMMITLPMFVPIVTAMGFDPVWFAAIYLLNMEMAGTTPPFGMNLFAMKGASPPDTTMGEIYRAALPFLYCDAIAMALLIAFPSIALWLPSLMRPIR